LAVISTEPSLYIISQGAREAITTVVLLFTVAFHVLLPGLRGGGRGAFDR
jgi:hypothetical protein